MFRFSIRLPSGLDDMITNEGRVHYATKSQYCETLIRNGLAVYMKQSKLNDAGDVVLSRLCTSIIRTGLYNIKVDEGMYRFSQKTYPSDPRKRVGEVSRYFEGVRNKATIVITDDLLECLSEAATDWKCNVSVVVFIFIQASLAIRVFKNLQEDQIPPERLQNAHELIDELLDATVVFKTNDVGVMTLEYEKKTRTEGLVVSKVIGEIKAQIKKERTNQRGGN